MISGEILECIFRHPGFGRSSAVATIDKSDGYLVFVIKIFCKKISDCRKFRDRFWICGLPAIFGFDIIVSVEATSIAAEIRTNAISTIAIP